MDCVLAIPCLNESARLPSFLAELCEALEKSVFSVGVFVVDDGSLPVERSAVEQAVQEQARAGTVPVQFKALPENRGKGFAIRAAWASTTEPSRFLAFVDADGAADAQAFLHVLEVAMQQEGECMVAGSRRAGGRQVERIFMRRVISKGFAWATRWSYGIDMEDTQCGCKLVSSGFYRSIESSLVEERFGLDLELILRAQQQGVPVLEVGIDWEEKGGTRLGLRHSLELFRDVLFRRIGRTKKA